MRTRDVRLARRPAGLPRVEDFTIGDVVLPEPQDGEVLVENLIMSVDPYIRLHLDETLPLGARLIGGGVGRVLSSRAGGFAEGQLVRHRQGFVGAFVCGAAALTPLVQDPDLPLEVYLSTLGGIGLCAYGGLLETGRLKAGEQVFVSAAAGAVGCLAVQIARLKGAYVVGSTGSAAKAAWLRDELGVDAVIDYHAEPLAAALEVATPRGLDLYFENVGGAHLEAALARMNLGGRIAVCGMISTYNGDGRGVLGLETMVIKRLSMVGFGFTDHPHLDAPFQAEMIAWLKSGAVRARETVLEGLDRAPEALVGLFTGLNTGKMLLRLAA